MLVLLISCRRSVGLQCKTCEKKFQICVYAFCLWAPTKADSKVKIWIAVINLRGDPRKNGEGMGKTEEEKKKLIHTCIYEHITAVGGGFPGSTNSKEPACQCRRSKRRGFDPWAWRIPWRRAWQPTPVFLPGESHGQRSLAGCSPEGC